MEGIDSFLYSAPRLARLAGVPMGAIPAVPISQNRCTDSTEILDVYDGQTLWKLHGAIIVTDRCESASLIAKTK